MKRIGTTLLLFLLVLAGVLLPATPVLAMDQVILGGGWANTLAVGQTEYNGVAGAYDWVSVENQKTQMVATAGTISNLYVEFSGPPGDADGEYFDITLMVNGAPSALTTRIKNAETNGSDTSNQVDVQPGDLISIRSNPSTGPPPDNAPYARWSVMHTGDTSAESVLLGNMRAFNGTGYAQLYQAHAVAAISTEADAYTVIPTAGTIKSLYVEGATDPGAGGDAWVFVLMVDGNPQTLTATITEPATTASDLVNEVAVVAGDKVYWRQTATNSPDNRAVAIGAIFVADIDGESLILGGTPNDLHNTTTEYMPLQTGYASQGWNSNEAVRLNLGQETTLRKFYVELSGAPGAGNEYDFQIRDSDGYTGVGCAVVDAATTCNDQVNTHLLTDNFEEVVLESDPDDTPAVQDAYWGVVGFIAPPAPPAVGNETSRGYILN